MCGMCCKRRSVLLFTAKLCGKHHDFLSLVCGKLPNRFLILLLFVQPISRKQLYVVNVITFAV